MATTTLAGNSGNNLLNASGLESTLVQGFQGQDTITLARVDDEGQGGEGNDTISLNLAGTHTNIARGGAGSDSITFVSADVFSNSVFGGDGDDSITIGTPAGDDSFVNQLQIAGNAGNDTVNLTTASRTVVASYIGLGQGNDSVAIATGSTLTSTDIFAGKGKDTLSIQGIGGVSNTINGGNGSDRLIIGTGALTSAKIGAGKGTDSIFFETGSVVQGSVAGGGLNDTISFAGGIAGASLTIFGDGNGVTTKGTGTDGGADGADLIGSTSSDAGGATIYGAGGADSIYVGGASGLIDGGNGSDSIVLNSAGASASVNGGAGTDVLRFNTGLTTIAALSTLNGGAGNDTLEFAGVADLVTTAGGTTANTIVSGNFNLVVAGTNSGDVIKFSGTGFVATSADNWLGNAPTVFVYTGSSDRLTALGATTGTVGVYSDGSDTYFTLASTLGTTGGENGFYRAVVQGVDLVNTTKTGETALNSTNFGFTLAQNNTTSDTGLVITIS